MNITKPEDKVLNISKLEEAVEKFEKDFAQEEPDQDYYHLVIVGEYNRQTCDEIVRIYTEAGWSKVECKTSSENGERPGLTGLQLYRQ